MSVVQYRAELAVQCSCTLGESPAWHEWTQTWWWVDIEERTVYQWNESQYSITRTYSYEERPSKLFADDAEHWIVATESGLHRWNFLTGEKVLLAALPHKPQHRTNDGCIDPWGRPWIGTMHESASTATGTLYRMPPQFRWLPVLHPVTIPNGLFWKNNTCYFIDSARPRLEAYRFNPVQNNLEHERTVIYFPESDGVPDGACLDAQGQVWVAFWGGSAVRRYDLESGQCLAKVNVPAPQVSSCAFGGPQYNQLLITTARAGMSSFDLQKHPLSGTVFILSLPVPGARLNKLQQYAGL